jgi:hypothetical protein
MVHAVMARVQPGEVLVLTMPEPRPVALIGDLLATQAKAQGAAAMLIDASVATPRSLRSWVCRSGRAGSASRARQGRRRRARRAGRRRRRDDPPRATSSCSTRMASPWSSERVEEVLAASLEREEKERVKRAKLQAGELLRPRRAARDRRRTRDRHRASRPGRAAHAEGRGEPALLRRADGDGDRGQEDGIGLSARLGRLSALQPQADRVGPSSGMAFAGPARVEPGGARAPGRAIEATGLGDRLERR